MNSIDFHNHSSFAGVFLNRPQKLNVLNEALVSEMNSCLDEMEAKPLILSAHGEKSFCAGGDVVDVVRKIKKGSSWDFFFKEEYGLDQRLYNHDCTALVHGIVMGGGMGLLQACKERIACEGSIFSMPEVTIGFFPDVGASFFLQRIPRDWSIFLAMTGARLPAIWAKRLGLIDHVVKGESYWKAHEAVVIGSEQWKTYLEPIDTIDTDSHFSTVDDQLKELLKKEDIFAFESWSQQSGLEDWIKQSLNFYREGSHASKVITWEMLQWSPGKNIKECFLKDLEYAYLCCEKGDFHEGVRALLIDKDKNPKWKDNSLQDSYERLRSVF